MLLITVANRSPSRERITASPSSTPHVPVTKKRKAENVAAAGSGAKRAAVRVYLLDVGGAVQIEAREDNTLFELMDALCTAWLDKSQRPGDGGVYDHLWQFSFNRREYEGPQPTVDCKNAETEGKSTALSELRLTPGESVLRVIYDWGYSTNFDIRVVSCSTVAADVARDFPREAPQRPVDGPFLTAGEIAASVDHRALLESTPETEFSTNQERVIKAQSRPWSDGEQMALTLLSMSGMKFAAAWRALLQHTLLFRAKTNASQRFYRLRRDARQGMPFLVGATPPEQALARAKRLLRNVRLVCLAARPRVARFQNMDEYKADLWRRMRNGEYP